MEQHQYSKRESRSSISKTLSYTNHITSSNSQDTSCVTPAAADVVRGAIAGNWRYPRRDTALHGALHGRSTTQAHGRQGTLVKLIAAIGAAGGH